MQKGDRVIIVKKSTRFSSKATITKLIESQVSGVITDVINGKGIGVTAAQICFKDTLKINHQGYNHHIDIENLKVITDLKKADKINKEFIKKVNLESKKLREDFRLYPKLGNRYRIITTDDIMSSAKKKLDYNFVTLGNISNDKFTPSQPIQKKAQCCSFTKVDRDLRVYIPKIWVNSFGYSEVNILTYLEFLKKCDFGFDYTYEGITDLPGDQLSTPSNAVEDEKYIYEISGKETQRIVSKKEEYYSVLVNKGKCYMQTYLNFICVRYLYNNLYWSIPATALQIHDKLKGKITHLQAFLMAHMRYSYYEYYSLIHKSLIVDIFQKPELFLKKLSDGYNMNDSFVYKQSAPVTARNQISSLLEKQQYQEALTLLESYK